jgi:hypothetical protein
MRIDKVKMISPKIFLNDQGLLKMRQRFPSQLFSSKVSMQSFKVKLTIKVKTFKIGC